MQVLNAVSPMLDGGGAEEEIYGEGEKGSRERIYAKETGQRRKGR